MKITSTSWISKSWLKYVCLLVIVTMQSM